MAITIRTATTDDAAAMRDIYRPYVEETAVTFEYEVPSLEEFTRRVQATLQRYPWLVAEDGGRIVGYAYAGAFKGRRAYDWSVETSIYLERSRRGEGTGRALYTRLEELLRAQGICNANACVAYAEVEDEHLTNNSLHFHQRLGYTPVGTFHSCAYKFGTWYSMMWLEKHLCEHGPVHDVIPFPELREA